jgi:mxaJ protein
MPMRARRSPVLHALAAMLALGAVLAAAPPRRMLRIAADPNNLPFTNRKVQGFENKIAELLARELDADLQYSWRAQRRGFFRESFKGDECDVVLGVPVGFERALTTAPYYRSTYVFVSRKDRGLKVRSFDDPALRTLKIGVQLIGVYGDYAEENPPARIVAAVAKDEVDIAVVWGPLAAYFARVHRGLEIVPVEPQVDASGLPMAFDIAVGVRKGNEALRDEIDAILARKREEIARILDDFGVPRVPPSRRTAGE